MRLPKARYSKYSWPYFACLLAVPIIIYYYTRRPNSIEPIGYAREGIRGMGFALFVALAGLFYSSPKNLGGGVTTLTKGIIAVTFFSFPIIAWLLIYFWQE
jgi:hypothetical protein